MKRIAFFVQQMMCAGVETSLFALVEQLQRERDNLEITIYVIEERGEMLSCIPEGVVFKKIPIPEALEKRLAIGGIKYTVRKQIKEKHYGMAMASIVHYVMRNPQFAELNVDFEKIPMLEEHYDIAVNYHMHSPFLVRYLAEKVKAEKKYTWIHNDFSTTKYEINRLKNYLMCCDGFYGVSQKLVDEFVEIFPQFQKKTKLFYNIIPVDTILKKSLDSAGEYEYKTKDVIRILSVGRLEEQKGFDIAITVCHNLLERGYNIQWLVVGEGFQRPNLERLIKKKKLKERFILIGAKTNPYPYFRVSDIYVQTSRHEGFGISIAEAKCFELPIICTNCAGADELIDDGRTGNIVQIDATEITAGVEKLIVNEKMRNTFKNNLLHEKMICQMGFPNDFLGGL